jgi:hypothetical protein
LLMPSGEVPTRASGTSKVVKRPLSSRKPGEGCAGAAGGGGVGLPWSLRLYPVGWHRRGGAHRERRHGGRASDGQANATASSAACYPGHAVSFQFASLPAVRVSGGGSTSRRASAWKPGPVLCHRPGSSCSPASATASGRVRPATQPSRQSAQWIGQRRGSMHECSAGSISLRLRDPPSEISFHILVLVLGNGGWVG